MKHRLALGLAVLVLFSVRAEAFTWCNPADVAGELASLSARAVQLPSYCLRALCPSWSGHGAWGWLKQSLVEPLVRRHTSQRAPGECAIGVEVETAQSVAGEAAGRSLGATGWAVRTREHLLILEYRTEERAAEMPTLTVKSGSWSGKEDPEVAVFASSVSVPCTEDKDPGLPQACAGDGMEITAFRTEGNGFGFLVRISGLVILHADDGGT